MALTERRLAGLLAYCRLHELAEDPEVAELIPILYEAAVGYLEGAGISEPPEGNTRRAQYDLCVNYLVLNSWDKRDSMVVGTVITENPAFRSVLNQLKLTAGMEPESGTEEA